MPELPEVETTARGIAPFLVGRKIWQVIVRQPNLRWPVPDDLVSVLTGASCLTVERRAKYLLLTTDKRKLLIHLGMTGSLRLVNPGSPLKPHDHLQFSLGSYELRYHDPRRFGCILWSNSERALNLLSKLGPEPFSDRFSGKWLHDLSRGRKIPVKTFIMTNDVVVGVGNIYSSESLAMAGIRPTRPANRISLIRYNILADAIRTVLSSSIELGGTTLRDFVNSQGEPGYFKQVLKVYGRAGKACNQCDGIILSRIISGRNSFYCPACQV